MVSLPSLYFASTRGKPFYWYLRMKKVTKPFSTNNTFIRCWALKWKHGRGVVSCTQRAVFVQDIRSSGFGRKSRQVSWNQSVDLRNLECWQNLPCAVLTFPLFGIQVKTKFNAATTMLVNTSMIHSRWERTTAFNIEGLVSLFYHQSAFDLVELIECRIIIAFKVVRSLSSWRKN